MPRHSSPDQPNFDFDLSSIPPDFNKKVFRDIPHPKNETPDRLVSSKSSEDEASYCSQCGVSQDVGTCNSCIRYRTAHGHFNKPLHGPGSDEWENAKKGITAK